MDFQFCYCYPQDLPHRCVGGGGIKRNQKKEISWQTTSPSWCSINLSDIYWFIGSSIFFKICVQSQCVGPCLSDMPAARLTVCRLVSNNHSLPVPFLIHPCPPILDFKLRLAQASGSQVDKPTSPPGGQRENLGKKTVSWRQIKEVSCFVLVLTRPSSQVHPQRGQLALHKETLQSTAPASNPGPCFTRVLVRKWIRQANPIFHNSLKKKIHL